MKILLIAPAVHKYLLKPNEKSKESKGFRFSLLSLLSIAACTPANHHVSIIDEHIDHLDFDCDVDIVGITLMTGHAKRAYEIGDEFLKRNKIVVFGGFHPSFVIEESLLHASSIVVGEGENLWPLLLQDINDNKLQKVYRTNSVVDISNLSKPPRHLLKKKNYITINTVQASRGCQNKCEFCSIHPFYKDTQRFRPISSVIEEIAELDSSYFLFMDDNIIGNRDYAIELFKSMIPLKKKWISQASITIAKDDELLNLSAKSGCRGVFVGIETFNENNLSAVDKTFNKVSQYKQDIKKIHDYGINIEAGLMFGFDNDEISVFESTLDFVDKTRIDAVQASIVTPLPGTLLYKKMKEAGRIIDERWENYDFRHAVFQPQKMTPKQLENGVDWFIASFYSLKNLSKKTIQSFARGNIESTILLNIPVYYAYYNDAKKWIAKEKKGRHPATIQSDIDPYCGLN